MIPTEKPWYIPNFLDFLTLIVVCGGAYILLAADQNEIKYAAVAQISTVLAYYYGTTKQSKAKDTTIEQLTKKEP